MRRAAPGRSPRKARGYHGGFLPHPHPPRQNPTPDTQKSTPKPNGPYSTGSPAPVWACPRALSVPRQPAASCAPAFACVAQSLPPNCAPRSLTLLFLQSYFRCFAGLVFGLLASSCFVGSLSRLPAASLSQVQHSSHLPARATRRYPSTRPLTRPAAKLAACRKRPSH